MKLEICLNSNHAWQQHSAASWMVESVIYRVSQKECARLRESVPYVKVHQYNPKHLYPKLNGYGDNGQRKVGSSCGSKYCNLHSWCVMRERWWPWEWNTVLIVPAWRLVACKGVGNAMKSAWCPKDDYGVNVGVYVVQFNGFMSLIR